jgi:hypothetical protein
MNVEIRIDAAQFLFLEYINGIFVAVQILSHTLKSFLTGSFFIDNKKQRQFFKTNYTL